MVKRRILISFFCFLVCNWAHADYKDNVNLPNKPGAAHVIPLIKVINSGDENKIEKFVKEQFDQSFLQRYPLTAHTNYLHNIHSRYGELQFHSSRDYDDPLAEHELVLILKSAKTEMWQAISLNVNQTAPNKITGVRFSPARVPSNLPKPPPLTLSQVKEELAAYVERIANRGVFSGSVLLAKGDELIYKGAYGLASKRFGVPNNTETRFNLGSMNKMFTSIAIMQLVEKGKLSLSDKLSKFVDQTWLQKEVSDKVEIRHLLTHSSGLGNYFNRTYGETSKNAFRALEDYKPLIVNDTLAFEPGTDNRYSNTGMFMLGVVIEKVSGQNYFEYIREHIYTPAGMTNSDSFEMDQPVANLAIGYTPDSSKETGWQNNLYSHVLKGGPAGGGFSTVQDLYQFARALTGYKLLNENNTKIMYSVKPELHANSYGYGFAVRGSEDNRVVGHGGGFAGISSRLDIYLDKGYIAVVLSNYSFGSDPVESKISQLLARVK